MKALGSLGVPAVEPLMGLLHDLKCASLAAEALGGIGAPAVEPLIDALHDKDNPGHWYLVIKALGCTGDPRAIEPVIETLDDGADDPGGAIAVAAARALGRLGGPRAVDRLVIMLRSPHFNERGMAAEALGQIGDARAAEPLSLTCRYDDDPNVRNDAANALKAIGDPRAIEGMRVGLRDTVGSLLATLADEKRSSFAMKSLVSQLERFSQSMDDDLLRRVAGLGDHVVYVWSHPNCSGSIPREEISCYQAKQLARQELIRRGLQA